MSLTQPIYEPVSDDKALSDLDDTQLYAVNQCVNVSKRVVAVTGAAGS